RDAHCRNNGNQGELGLDHGRSPAFHSKPKADATLVDDQETPRCLLNERCVQCTRSPIRYC
ncbi:MAG: hypothetical protein WB764_04480, partial [Xanthobacteraceae bacterium]